MFHPVLPSRPRALLSALCAALGVALFAWVLVASSAPETSPMSILCCAIAGGFFGALIYPRLQRRQCAPVLVWGWAFLLLVAFVFDQIGLVLWRNGTIALCLSVGFVVGFVRNRLWSVHAAIVALLGLYTGILFLNALILAGPTNWDIWQVFDLAESFKTGDLYHTSMYRWHAVSHSYSASFPYVYPLLMAVFNAFFHQGCAAYIFINFGVLVVSFAVLRSITVKMGNAYAWVPLALAMLLIPSYMEEIRTGGTTPVNLLAMLLLARLLLFASPENLLESKRVICIGAICGAGAMCRFDFIPVAASCFLYIAYLSWRARRLKPLIIFAAVMALLLLPWFLHSFLRFGKLFVTDNGRRIVNVLDTRPSTFFMEGEYVETIFNSFGAWCHAATGRVLTSLSGLIKCCSGWVQWAYFAAFISILFMGRLMRHPQMLRRLGLIGLLFFPSSMAVVMTGYPDERYHAPMLVYLMLACLLIVIAARSRGLLALLSAVCVLSVCLKLVHTKRSFYRQDLGLAHIADLSSWSQGLVDYAEAQRSCPRVAFSRSCVHIRSVERLTARRSMRSTGLPTNFRPENARAFVDFYALDYIYTEEPKEKEMFEAFEWMRESDTIPGLYEVQR